MQSRLWLVWFNAQPPKLPSSHSSAHPERLPGHPFLLRISLAQDPPHNSRGAPDWKGPKGRENFDLQRLE